MLRENREGGLQLCFFPPPPFYFVSLNLFITNNSESVPILIISYKRIRKIFYRIFSRARSMHLGFFFYSLPQGSPWEEITVAFNPEATTTIKTDVTRGCCFVTDQGFLAPDANDREA